MDNSNENSLFESLHIYLRSGDDDDNAGLASFSIGTSISNQRIESFGSNLIKDGPGWWRNFFKDLCDLDLIDDSDPAQFDCLRFCLMGILSPQKGFTKWLNLGINT